MLLLWSYGRFTAPLTAPYLAYPSMPSLFGQVAVSIGVLLQMGIFIYTLHLMAQSRRVSGGRVVWWEFALYVYVLLSITASLLFTAYQLGMTPSFLASALLFA